MMTPRRPNRPRSANHTPRQEGILLVSHSPRLLVLVGAMQNGEYWPELAVIRKVRNQALGLAKLAVGQEPAHSSLNRPAVSPLFAKPAPGSSGRGKLCWWRMKRVARAGREEGRINGYTAHSFRR